MEDRRAFPSLVRALGALVGMYVGINGLSLLLNVLLQRLSARGIIVSPALSYTASGAVELVCVGTAAVLWSRRGERRAAGVVRRDALGPEEAALIVLAALTWIPVMNMLSTLWCALLDAAGITYSQGMAVPESASEIAACLLATAVIAPVCEEEFFRGRFFAALETLGTRKAVAISTLFFAALHGQIGALPAHLCVGLMLALLLVRRRSIYAPMLFHACYNGALVLLSVLPGRVFEGLAPGMAVAGMVFPFALFFALRPCARMYILPEGRPMRGCERKLMALLAAAFAIPYVLSMMK